MMDSGDCKSEIRFYREYLSLRKSVVLFVPTRPSLSLPFFHILYSQHHKYSVDNDGV